MKLTALINDERAVSPVIGVILMVAITVILAAVIGTFVLGLGNSLGETAPNANFQFDYESAGNAAYDVTAIHKGGATISEDNAGNLTLNAGSDSATFSGWPGGVSSGDTAELLGVSNSTDVSVVWTSSDGSNSQTLAEGSTPS